FRFYLAKKTIDAEKDTAKIKDAVVPFQTKLQLAGQMLIDIGHLLIFLGMASFTEHLFRCRKTCKMKTGDRCKSELYFLNVVEPLIKAFIWLVC
ncbi:MAG: hypothetical protein PHY54_18970, partial [Methylococcales bacterium]|nr:hypothetical protein [Methylococcales bacterium]